MNQHSEHDYARRFRLDVKFESVADPVTGQPRLAALFDPERYHLAGEGDEQMLVDRLDQWAMPLAEVRRMIEEGLTSPWTGKGPLLSNAREYIAQRCEPIRSRLRTTGAADKHEFVDRSEEYLAALPDGVHGFAVISIDLVGSTKLSSTLDPVTNARVIGVVLEELAAVAPYFHAHVLKFTGDGVLAYIPPDSFLTANDNAIDCALTMRSLMRDAVNPALTELAFPAVDVRIGIESGAAVALTVGHETSKQHRDLIGKTLNLACKVQASGQPGEIRIGQVAYQNMHTMWKRGCEGATLPQGWAYTLADGRPYPLYTFVADGAILDDTLR